MHRGGNEIPVGENGPLGQAGGTSGKLDQGRVVRQNVNPGQSGTGSIFEQLRKMMPPFFQFQFLRRALPKSFDVIGYPGDDNPGDIHLLAQGPDIGQDHIEGKKCGNTWCQP